MTVHTFACIMLVCLALLSVYALLVSTNEPPLEHYESTEDDRESHDPASPR